MYSFLHRQKDISSRIIDTQLRDIVSAGGVKGVLNGGRRQYV